MKSIFLAASLATLLKISIFPNTSLLLWMIIALCIDFITGILKSYSLQQARTSQGFRKTVTKISQYGLCIVGSMVFANVADQKSMDTAATMLYMFSDGLVVFLTYIELTSIFENLYEMNPTSKLSQYFIKYVLNILTFQLKNNPVTKITKSNDPETTV